MSNQSFQHDLSIDQVFSNLRISFEAGQHTHVLSDPTYSARESMALGWLERLSSSLPNGLKLNKDQASLLEGMLRFAVYDAFFKREIEEHVLGKISNFLAACDTRLPVSGDADTRELLKRLQADLETKYEQATHEAPDLLAGLGGQLGIVEVALKGLRPGSRVLAANWHLVGQAIEKEANKGVPPGFGRKAYYALSLMAALNRGGDLSLLLS